MQIEQRVQAIKDFAAMLDCLPCGGGDDLAYRIRICELMREYADTHLGKPATSTLLVMNDAQASRFELDLISFGTYLGTQFRDVPIQYLDWVADQSVRLQAYLRSDAAKKRREREIT